MQRMIINCDWCKGEVLEYTDHYKCLLQERQSLIISRFKSCSSSAKSVGVNEEKDFCGENCLMKFISENLSKL